MMNVKHAKAWLFDFDGVIGDTMPDNLRAWQSAFAQHGVTLTKDDYYSLEGMNTKGIAETLGKKFGLAPAVYEKIPDRKSEFYQILAGPLRIYPEVDTLLTTLKRQGVKLAMVSGGARWRLEKTTPKKIFTLFDVVVAGDDLTKSKPDPEPYTMALAKLGVRSDQAVVVENAPLGIDSAKTAGIFCVALTTTVDRALLGSADIVLTDISELLHVVS